MILNISRKRLKLTKLFYCLSDFFNAVILTYFKEKEFDRQEKNEPDTMVSICV